MHAFQYRNVVRRTASLALVATLGVAVLPVFGHPRTESPTPRAVQVLGQKRAGLALMTSHSPGAASGAAGAGSPGSGHLVYGGSALMQNPKLYQVIWGARGPGRSYLPSVTDGTLAKAYKSYIEGDALDWIRAEYSTPLYKLGRGTFVDSVTLSLRRSESRGNSLTQGDVEAELAAQIDARALPADPDAMFMINFPPEVQVRSGLTDHGVGRGAGTIPVGCPAGKEEDAGLCYTPCRPGFSGVGPVCWGTCAADHHNDGATCRKDVHVIAKASYGRGAGAVPSADCGAKQLDGGLCYSPCPSGFHGVGPVCWQGCPAGSHDDGATCRIDAHITSSDNSHCPWYDKCGLATAKGCSHCPPGYHNDGCTCRRDVHIVAKQSQPRGVGTPPAQGCGTKEKDAGLCYSHCRTGFRGVGPVCWAACPEGYRDDGATCRIDASIVARPSYGRGVGTPRTSCGPGKEYDAGLCYSACPQDYHGVGPVCWGRDSFCRGNDGFCGFHSSFLRNAARVRYGVLADMGASSPCSDRCQVQNDPFGALTKVFSHELVEAMTDPDLFLGWNDVTNGEIGDLCNDVPPGKIPFTDGSGTFTVQQEWSNKSNACRL